MLIDGGSFEGVYDTELGPVMVLCRIVIEGQEVIFDDVFFYPLSSVNMKIGVRAGMRIFRDLLETARAQGFSHCTLKAFRSSGAAPGRMLDIRRRLR